MIHKKTLLAGICFSEIFMMILSTFAFAFMIASALAVTTVAATPVVDAISIPGIAKSCCEETIEGARCQEMNSLDYAMCKTPLILSGCDTIDTCQKGCCFDSSSGICATNAPKQKCLDNGGNWSNNDICNIDQCEMGCCILGAEATLTTSTQCSKLASEFKFSKNFQALDADGSCTSYQDLGKLGACVVPLNDYSGENNCKFTTKENCLDGRFYTSSLCSAPELNTICTPTKNTGCLAEKDEIYYLDSCGNTANIYDSSKVNDTAYWSTIVSKSDSCVSQGKDCGNCNYISGSKCYEVRKNKDPAPTYGNNVCRNLNCENGRKHGESWCISDYNQDLFGASPMGSRFFRGVCMDGEITIEPCADFNQEICSEVSGSGGYTQAKCQVNQWRSCLVANDKPSYVQVESECKKYDQCMMFLDNPYSGPTTFGNLTFASTNGTAPWVDMLGNKKDDFDKQGGMAGDIGKDNNKGYVYCVPKYTPGMVFWQQEAKSYSTPSANAATSKTTSSYGGSIAETSAICSLGEYTSVSHQEYKYPSRRSILTTITTGGTNYLLPDTDWEDKENWEFNSLATDSANRNLVTQQYAPTILMSLNEKCRMIGSCGEQANVAGEIANIGSLNDTLKRNRITEKSELLEMNIKDYKFPQGYEDYLKQFSGIKIMGSIKKLTDALLAGKTAGTDEETATGEVGTRASDTEITDTTTGAQTEISTAAAAERQAMTQNYMNAFQGLGAASAATSLAIGSYTAVGVLMSGGSFSLAASGAGDAIAGSGAGAAGGMVIGAAIGAIAGYALGKYLAKQYGMSPGESVGFIGMMVGIGMAVGLAIGLWIAGASMCATVIGCIAGIIIFIIAIVLTVYSGTSTGVDNRYDVTQYNCNMWEAPQTGTCELCNTDVRPCSEYRCKSLGKNCQYFNDLGEPGYCGALKDTGSATINPWLDLLNPELTYSDIASMSFSIKNKNLEPVPAQQGIEFGITTDKQAECKIDTRHTSSYNDMATSFIIDNSDLAWVSGSHHRIAISPFITENGTSQSTLSMKPGENKYYVRCINFAGSYNLAEFAITVNVGEGPDLTPPIISQFTPESGTYLANNTNSSEINLLINEPSECRYSQGEDKLFADMTSKLTCINSNPVLGKWPCLGTLTNLTAGTNKFYFQCKDHPDYANRSEEKRNTNKVSKIYTLNVCNQGLEIEDIYPKNKLVSGKSPLEIDLKVQTKGCVNGGNAICSYGINNSNYIEFESTGTKSHSQKFTSIIPGKYNISIICQDDASNVAYGSAVFEFDADNTPPQIIRHYDADKKLIIVTNEKAICRYTQNTTLGCGFDFTETGVNEMTGTGTYHTAPGSYSKEYFIRCQDVYNNTNVGCGINIKDLIIK